jgi:IS5 family transposase
MFQMSDILAAGRVQQLSRLLTRAENMRSDDWKSLLEGLLNEWGSDKGADGLQPAVEPEVTLIV